MLISFSIGGRFQIVNARYFHADLAEDEADKASLPINVDSKAAEIRIIEAEVHFHLFRKKRLFAFRS